MKRLLLATVALAAFATSPVLAADTIIEEPIVGFSWTGAFVGIQGGYAWGDSTATYPLDGGSTEIDPDGWLGGVYVGYNHQLSNNVVLGVDADIAYSNVDGTGQYIRGAPIAGSTDSVDLNWSGAVRGRLGYAVDRFLPYVAAGVAFGDFDVSSNDLNPAFAGNFSETYIGYTVGAGVEFAATDNLIIRAEYRFTDFGSESFTATDPNSVRDVDLETHDIRVGIAYKF